MRFQAFTAVISTVVILAISAAFPVSAKKVTIRVAHAWEPTFLDVQKAFDRDFMKRHPDIQVKMENMDWGSLVDKYTTMAAAGTSPDIMYVHWSFAQNFIRRNMFLNLSAYIKKDPKWDFGDIFPVASIPFQWKGSMYGIPYDAGPVLPYYNKMILKNLGLNYPFDDWTWEEFLMICKKATKDNNGDGRMDQWGTERYYDDELLPAPLVKAWGGEFLNKDESAVLLNSPEAIEGLQWFADLNIKHKVVSNVGEAFTQGRTAMTFGGSWMMERYLRLKKFDADVAHMPSGPKGQFATVYGSGYCISASSKVKDAAWTYLKEYLSKDGMETMWGRSGRGSPARKSAWKSFEEAWKGKRVGVFAKAFDYSGYGGPLSPVSPRFREILWRELNSVIQNKKSMIQAVQAIKREGDPILKSVKYK